MFQLSSLDVAMNDTDDFNSYVDDNSLYDKYVGGFNSASKYMRLVAYALGFPGNLLAVLVWTRRPMLHSSGVYLAALALSDLLFLTLDLPYSLHTEWSVPVLDFPVVCEGFTIVYLAAQYMSPLLNLAFTTERYIAIKFPLKRRLYCTVKRAIMTSGCITLLSVALCGIQGYFWTFNTDVKACIRTPEADQLWGKWTWCTEMIMFLLVPIVILLLNILVIFEIQNSRKIAIRMNRIMFKTTATTTMLLAVSFFLILTTLPVSIIYILGDYFPVGVKTKNIETNKIWQDHFRYFRARSVVYNIGLTHFFMNFYIYLFAGERFRRQVLNILRGKQIALANTRHRFETTKMESFYSSDTV